MLQITNKLKTRLVGTTAGIIIGASAVVGADNLTVTNSVNQDFSNILDEVSILQENYKIENNKYLHIPRFEVSGYEVQVNEYVTPNNEVGYDVVVNRSVGDNIISRVDGVGPENSLRRTKNWFNKLIITATTTP